MKKISTISILFIALLTGCASHMPLSRENAQGIKTIYVDPKIQKPTDMYNYSVASNFGLIGELAVMNEKKVTQEVIEKKFNTDIRRIVYNQFQQQINVRSKFKTVNQRGDATLIADIKLYGISVEPNLTTDYVPVLAIKAKLMRDGQTLWQDSESVFPLFADGMPRHKIDSILRDPKIIYAMWNKASEKVVRDMILDMNK